jgi:tetratricopeptide (TPR) repeat protein
MSKAPFFARRRSLKLIGEAHDAYERNRVDEARSKLASALKDDPRSADAEFLLGRIANDEGDYPVAAEHLGRATTFAPKSAEAFGELGRALHELRRRPEAEAAYKRSLELHDDPYMAINMATLLRDAGRFEEATVYYRRALEGRGLDPETRARIQAAL